MFPGFDPIEPRSGGSPNLARILAEDGWKGHPLRTDYPVGGEPVGFPRTS